MAPYLGAAQAASPGYDPGLEFSYGIDINLNANQALNNQSTQILDKAFRWRWAIASSAGAFSIQIFDGKSNRPFSNQQILGSLLFGTAQNPFPILTPWIFTQGGTIKVNVTDLSGAGNAVHLCFRGEELNS